MSTNDNPFPKSSDPAVKGGSSSGQQQQPQQSTGLQGQQQGGDGTRGGPARVSSNPAQPDAAGSGNSMSAGGSQPGAGEKTASGEDRKTARGER